MTIASATTDVLVVGGGPAGLSAAIALRGRGVPRVTVVEREADAGGIPRHTDHTGFGLRDRHRLFTGPEYARRLVDDAVRAGVDVATGTTAIEWAGERSFELVGERGRRTIDARAVILATGTRERPRAARLVPGDRPAGVLTTGALQQLVTFDHVRVGRRAVIVGAEHVSFSAVLTLAEAGCRTVALVTELPRHQTYWPLRLATASRHRAPVLAGVGVARIVGRRRVEAVELTDGRSLACDTVVFTGDWVPDHELARRGGFELAPGSLAPVVDTGLRTARPGVFAAGNLLHGAETADVCALDGRHVADPVMAWLETGDWPRPGVPVVADPPVRWVHPMVVRPHDAAPPRGRLLLRVATFVPGRRLSVVQGGRVLWMGSSRHDLVPNRSIALPAQWLELVDAEGPAVHVSATDLR